MLRVAISGPRTTPFRLARANSADSLAPVAPRSPVTTVARVLLAGAAGHESLLEAHYHSDPDRMTELPLDGVNLGSIVLGDEGE